LWWRFKASISAEMNGERAMVARRDILIGFGAAAVGSTLPFQSACALVRDPGHGYALLAEIKRIEAAVGGRLGVAMLDTGSGHRFGWRNGERFPMCSTFKFLLAAAVLRQVEQGRERLDRAVAIAKSDFVGNSPVVEQHFGGSLTVSQLCEATVTLSDNAAANLLLPSVGGIVGFNAFLRSLGDTITRLDRTEPMMSEAIPGDPRDTTTPEAMVRSMRAVLIGRALAPASRAQATRWLIANKTGDTRLRAGLPSDWRVGDKTGTSENGATNDIAILWPPSRKPLLVTAYLAESKADAAARYGALADVARAVARYG
jgi:beta-lactamase class A